MSTGDVIDPTDQHGPVRVTVTSIEIRATAVGEVRRAIVPFVG